MKWVWDQFYEMGVDATVCLSLHTVNSKKYMREQLNEVGV